MVLDSWSNWNSEMLIFVEGGKPETLGKTLKAREKTNKQLNLHSYDAESIVVRDVVHHPCFSNLPIYPLKDTEITKTMVIINIFFGNSSLYTR
jgi:hypothetical protein